MRLRKFKKLQDIKADPDARLVFPPKNYPDYLDLAAAGGEANLTVTALCRAIVLTWIHEYTTTTVTAMKEAMRLRIIQRVHGIEQTSLFQYNPRAKRPKIPKSVGELISRTNSKRPAKTRRKGAAKK